MAKKFYPVNRNMINLIKINVSQMTFGPAGYHGLQMLSAQWNRFSVIFTCFRMPGSAYNLKSIPLLRKRGGLPTSQLDG
jgi:hypothetical protein